MSCCGLETERLLLRKPEEADVPAITAMIGDWDVVKNLATAPYPYLEEHARQFIARIAEGRATGESQVFAITRKPDGAYMGTIGLHLRDGAFEIGYWLGKPYWGQGFMTEAVACALDLAFRPSERSVVLTTTDPANKGSQNVLRKSGFTYLGIFPRRVTGLRGAAEETRWELRRESHTKRVIS